LQLDELYAVLRDVKLSPEIAGSLQYAGSHLQTPLFVVLGHEGAERSPRRWLPSTRGSNSVLGFNCS
jgi:hypothetical protein